MNIIAGKPARKDPEDRNAGGEGSDAIALLGGDWRPSMCGVDVRVRGLRVLGTKVDVPPRESRRSEEQTGLPQEDRG